jgi:hypothetical protein
MKKIVRLAFAWGILLTFVPQGPQAQHTPPDAQGTSKIVGKVLDAKGERVRDARVLAYHLSSERLFSSQPSGGKGEYEITGLPYGYFDLAVETPDGLFVSNRVVNVAPAGTSALIFTVVPYQPATAGSPRRHPGSDREPSGIAETRDKAKGRDFWRSPKGVAVLAGIGGAGLLAIASGSDSELNASVF